MLNIMSNLLNVTELNIKLKQKNPHSPCGNHLDYMRYEAML